MTVWQWLLSRRFSHDLMRGQGLVEYALLIVLVAIVVLVFLLILGPDISDIYANVIDRL